MSMTRNDFETIAEQFKREHETIADKDYLSETTREFQHAAIDRMAERIAVIAYIANRRFSFEKFLLACGMRADLVTAEHCDSLRNAIGFFGARVP